MSDIIQGTGVPKLVLGQKLYIPCYRQDIIVEALIEELHDIYVHRMTVNKVTATIWHSYDINGMNDAYIRADDGSTNPSPFSIERLDDEAVLMNQFPWTNFPTWGHAAYIGDDAFVTLKEARKWIQPSNKKHLMRRLKEATRWTRKEFPNYRLSNYKVYVR